MVFTDLENGDLELENGASQREIAGNADKKDPLKVMTNISFQSYQQETEQHKNHSVKIKKKIASSEFLREINFGDCFLSFGGSES